MIALMNENGLVEFEMEKDGLKIRLKKNSQGSYEQSLSDIQRAGQTPSKENGQSLEAPKLPVLAAKTVIKSPMVGTFYAAPAPDAPPFVQPGSQIEIGQVICVIEAMKLMNEIKSEVRGKIAEAPVHNGDPVEFGQPLFVLE